MTSTAVTARNAVTCSTIRANEYSSHAYTTIPTMLPRRIAAPIA
jgi:hypothetical protein